MRLAVHQAKPQIPLSHIACTAHKAGLHYDPAYQSLIFRVEQALRQCIDLEMTLNYGKDWLAQTANPTRLNIWRQRQAKALANGEASFPLICFTDFPDLKDIIANNRHWRLHFAARFGVKINFINAMDSFYAVRKPLAHSRPISAQQSCQLYAAAGYLMNALKAKSPANSNLLFSVKSVK